jgi:hypothetical protein
LQPKCWHGSVQPIRRRAGQACIVPYRLSNPPEFLLGANMLRPHVLKHLVRDMLPSDLFLGLDHLHAAFCPCLAHLHVSWRAWFCAFSDMLSTPRIRPFRQVRTFAPRDDCELFRPCHSLADSRIADISRRNSGECPWHVDKLMRNVFEKLAKSNMDCA